MSECVDKKLGVLLHAYELNALAEADAERFELHLLECEHCFREVEAFGCEVAVLRTDEGIKAAARKSSRENLVEKFLRRFSGGRKTAVPKALAVIAALLILAIPAYLVLNKPAMLGGGELQSLTLTQFRSGTPPLKISLGDKARIEFAFREAAPGKSYLVRIMSVDDSLAVESHEFSEFDEGGMGQLVISLRDKQPGIYSLTIIDPNVKPVMPLIEYNFRIMP